MQTLAQIQRSRRRFDRERKCQRKQYVWLTMKDWLEVVSTTPLGLTIQLALTTKTLCNEIKLL